MRVSSVKDRADAISERGRAWVERQDPASPTGVGIGAWRHYRRVEGPLQSALLSLDILVAVLPALLVMEEYLDPHPNSLANSLVHHYRLNAPTATLIRGVLGEGHAHELGSALLAIAGRSSSASASAGCCSSSTHAPGSSRCARGRATRCCTRASSSPSTA
jgi:hypothetical protein